MQAAFHNDLKNEPITMDEHNHALYVWDRFGCKKFNDYHLLYLLSDIMLLGCVMAKFRKLAMDDFGLDPAHFYR